MSDRRKIIGVTVGTTTPRANLGQTDPKKADYVRGREALAGKLDANQGAENANKALFVGDDGKVIPKEIGAVSGKDGGFYMPSLNIVDEDTISIGFQYYSSGTPMGVIPPKNIDLPAGKDGYTPQKGVDYFDGRDGVDGYTPVKGKDYFDGKDGATPHIGANGNWFIGDTDTGSPSCGEVDGEDVSAAVEDYFAENPVVTEESDPTVPAWAKESTKPSYTKSEVGLGNVDNVKQYSANNPPPYPVTSVNGKTGAVTLDAAAVSARPNNWTPSAADVGADAKGTANTAVTMHNVAEDAHNDIRLQVADLITRLNALANSTDEELDQMAELVSYIKENRELISGITTDKVNVADIINNLTTNVSNKPLSAAQGVALKALIDAIKVPTKLGELTNDKGYITGYTETDPTVPSWAKASSKPSYTASEVGAVPTSRTVNGKALSGNITLSASDVGARSSSWIPSAANIQSALGYVPASQSATITITGKDADGNTHVFEVIGWEGGANEPT